MKQLRDITTLAPKVKPWVGTFESSGGAEVTFGTGVYIEISDRWVWLEESLRELAAALIIIADDLD
jgi:hypothetical protein